MNNGYYIIMILCALISAVSQLLLKQSARKKHKSWLYEYLNCRVIISYSLFFAVLLANTYAYTKVEMKYGAVIDSLGYLFIMIFSWLILKEKITRRKLLGNLIIILGVIVYTMP